MATQQSARMRVQALMVDEDVAGTTGDWVVFGANIWWYPICYSVLTVVLGFVGSTLQCRSAWACSAHRNCRDVDTRAGFIPTQHNLE